MRLKEWTTHVSVGRSTYCLSDVRRASFCVFDRVDDRGVDVVHDRTPV